MFANHFAAAIEAAHPAQLDHCARDLWRAHAAGLIADIDTQRFAEAIEARRADRRIVHLSGAGGIAQGKLWRRSIFLPRREQLARRHPERIERRRRLASSGPLPPALASQWTTARLAILRIVGDEVRETGICELTLAEIAARAGSCRSMARTTLRQAAELGLVIIEERRRKGQKNLPNRVRIVSREWRTWLKRGPRRSSKQTIAAPGEIGGKKAPPTDMKLYSRVQNRIQSHRKNGFGETQRLPQPVPPKK